MYLWEMVVLVVTHPSFVQRGGWGKWSQLFGKIVLCKFLVGKIGLRESEGL
jgi:hypothetical protein